MLSISISMGEDIVGRYVAESITTDAGRFSLVGLCQLLTNLFSNILHQLLLILLCICS